MWTDLDVAILVYASRRDWVLETDAATFARQHDPDAAALDVDDALERLEGQGLIAASGKPTELRITLRGQAFLQALHEARHDRAALGRARGLFGGEIRPNPAQGSFSWAGDPRQLTMTFDAPKPKASPEASPETRAAFGAASAAQLRRQKPQRAAKPKAEPKPRKAKSPYGAPIIFDAGGNLTEQAYHAWARRWARHEGVKPPMGEFANDPSRALDTWARFEGTDREKRYWRTFWKAWQAWRQAEEDAWTTKHQGYPGDETILENRWKQLLGFHNETEATHYAIESQRGLPDTSEDRSAFRRFHYAGRQLDAGAFGDNAPKLREAYHEAWQELRDRWLDAPGPRWHRNPAASTELRSTRGKSETRQRIAGYRSEIRSQRTEQKRARADRKAELDQARGQTKRIRAKVTTASAGRRARIRQRAWDRIDRARARIEEMRRYWAEERGKGPPPGSRKRTAGEQTEEVEREIRAIDPMLVPLWRANRGLFKGTAHERFERFLEWADEQGEADVWAAIEKTLPTDAALARDYEAWIESQDDPAYLAWKAAQSAA